MRDTQLVLIDGLPGSGKSTTAEWLAGLLREYGTQAPLFLERQTDHPLNVGGDLHPSGSITGEAFFARYSAETFASESLLRWRTFARNAQNSDAVQAVQVVESYPFQNSVRILLQMDARPNRIRDYEEQVEEIIAALNPVLLYFDHSDAAHALRRTCEQRGPEFTAYLVEVVTGCAYARTRNLIGWDGALCVISDYKEWMDTLVARFRFPLLVLRDCHEHWERCRQQIRTFLELA